MQFCLLSIPLSKNELSNDHVAGVALGMRETAVKRFKFPAVLVFTL